MLLTIDVGSTETKLGLWADTALRHRARLATERGWRAADWGAALTDFLNAAGVAAAALDGIAVACVGAAVERPLREACEQFLGRTAEFVGKELRATVPIRYDPPESLGPDRVANAVAARARHGTPVLVVDVGTAITFDAVSADGAFAGGAILAGPLTAVGALRQLAPHLPATELVRPDGVIGGSTAECLQVGAYYGLLGQVEGIARRMRATLGMNTRVVATGGLAFLLAAEPGIVDEVDTDLTLAGIRILWDQSHSSR